LTLQNRKSNENKEHKSKNMKKTLYLLSFFLLLIFVNGCSSFHGSPNQSQKTAKDTFYSVQIKTDTLFKSKQIINQLVLPNKSFKRYTIVIGNSQPELVKTSLIAQKNNAIAAINGGFFDRDHGGSVTYFELNDSVISQKRPDKIKWAVPDSLTNGTIVLTKNHKIIIEPARTSQFYEESKEEAAVLVTGPLLIYHSKLHKLPKMEFTFKRHPRTCLCITKESVIFVAIDGRSEQAAGMSLIETQKYLMDLGCYDAINLDGGGSTTMWINNKGIINYPSDKEGERLVSNAILLLKK
jgi:exopolysaccharide biosynthesis protein